MTTITTILGLILIAGLTVFCVYTFVDAVLYVKRINAEEEGYDYDEEV